MNLLSVPQVRLKQLQSLAENSLTICSGVNELKPQRKQVENRLNEFIEGMLKSKASAAQKKLFDNQRDGLSRGLFRDISAESLFPHTQSEAISVVKSLTQLNNKYGISIVNLGYNEQTAATDNLLADLKQIDFGAIPNSSIPRWIPLIEKANNEFKMAASNFISREAKKLDIESASSVVPALTESLEEMYSMLFAYSKVNPTEEIKSAYTELEVLINSYR